MDASQEVKSRLNIEDVVAEYVQLKRAGRNFKGLSPWTNEKTPSFIVSPEKQIWHDFSSGKGGDVFSFVMEMEGLDFRGALETLARKAGVDLEQYKGAGRGQSQLKNRLLEALELSAKFYQKQLTTHQPSLKYLIKERAFPKKIVLDWRFGYSPNTGRALTDFLLKKGFKPEELKKAGLSTERRGQLGDMFRGRIMIPLSDAQGRVVGFTARQLVEEPNSPKYINTPSTLVYDKGRQVFGLHLAKETIRKQNFVVVVEGNMDVIASHQAGVANVVASAGTAMTEAHLRDLKRFTGDVRLCFDADRAGIEATERVIPLAQKVGVNLSIIDTGKAKDPDELIRQDAKAWQRAVEAKTYVVDWLIERYKKRLDLDSASGKREFTDAILPTIGRLLDPVEREHYQRELATLTGISFESILAKQGGKVAAEPRRKTPQIDSANLDKDQIEQRKLEDHWLAIIFMQPKTRDLASDMKDEFFSSEPAKAVLKFVQKQPNYRGDAQTSKLLRPQADYVKILGVQFEELYAPLPEEDLRELAKNLRHRLVERYVKNQKRQLAVAMSATIDDAKLKTLIRKADKLNTLIKQF